MKNLSELSLEELKTKEKQVRSMLPVLGSMLVLVTICSLILIIRRGFSPVSIIPATLIPILLINAANLKKIRAEIAEREQAGHA